MQLEHYGWESPRLGRYMHVARYGHWGPPLIVFPTSHGGWSQFEGYGMHRDCEWFLENGRMQFFSIHDVNDISWYNAGIPPEERLRVHRNYEEYFLQELIPFIWHLARNDRYGVMGCSFGAYQAANVTLRHPDVLKYCFTFSGEFDISEFLEGHHDDQVYFNNPVEFVPGMKETWQAETINRECKICLMTGKWDFSWDGTRKLHDSLDTAGINHTYEVWDEPFEHNENSWKQQLPNLLGRFF